jgi:hypothetical protein
MTTELPDNEPPKQTAGDLLHAAIRAGISALPLIGGPGVELFNLLISPPLEKRRTEWMQLVAEALEKLSKEKRVNLEDLKNNEEFVDVLLLASQAAVRTSHQRKREALKNAVVNTALPRQFGASQSAAFIHLVDELTPCHLMILELLRDPVEWFKGTGVIPPQFDSIEDLNRILSLAAPILAEKPDFIGFCHDDLHARNLMGKKTGPGSMDLKRPNRLAEELLDFIKSPERQGDGQSRES